MAISDYTKKNRIYDHVKRHGSKCMGKWCIFDSENLCDMLCAALKLKLITKDTSTGPRLLAECFCTKFDPPIRLVGIKIDPLDEEEAKG